jgi:hypothetical protein
MLTINAVKNAQQLRTGGGLVALYSLDWAAKI